MKVWVDAIHWLIHYFPNTATSFAVYTLEYGFEPIVMILSSIWHLYGGLCLMRYFGLLPPTVEKWMKRGRFASAATSNQAGPANPTAPLGEATESLETAASHPTDTSV